MVLPVGLDNRTGHVADLGRLFIAAKEPDGAVALRMIGQRVPEAQQPFGTSGRYEREMEAAVMPFPFQPGRAIAGGGR